MGGGRRWFSMFCITFCRLLARNIAITLLECFDSDFFSINVYNRILKSFV